MAVPHGMLIYNNDITPDSLVDIKGEQKIVEHVKDKLTNSSMFKIEKEDHTIANMLQMKLHRSPNVLIAGYRVPHPTQHRLELRVQTAPPDGDDRSGKTVVPAPKEALKTAIEECLADLQEFEALLRAEAQAKGLDAAFE
ncbi:DNA-directed RNA polymerase II subunit RPB11 [Strigomonas culicis]|uniref:DNA-directed RNA polymerase II subunit RPB11 n=1 Tax=Strigomonas culicis TaxID=28005 RepID=S9V003_9TRYP|nr:DNA-directed RNA polymerase II subunit RPB11 [Strigomonas culicis]|eukprot:EPY34349.1 DNA-directed RNA polymerase II subunit RPB11 [Strigomonas culicis]